MDQIIIRKKTYDFSMDLEVDSWRILSSPSPDMGGSHEQAVLFRARGWEAPLGADATEALEKAREVMERRPTGAVSISRTNVMNPNPIYPMQATRTTTTSSLDAIFWHTCRARCTP